LRQKVRTSAFEEPLPPCLQNVRTGQTTLFTDRGRLLWTAPYGFRFIFHRFYFGCVCPSSQFLPRDGSPLEETSLTQHF